MTGERSLPLLAAEGRPYLLSHRQTDPKEMDVVNFSRSLQRIGDTRGAHSASTRQMLTFGDRDRPCLVAVTGQVSGWLDVHRAGWSELAEPAVCIPGTSYEP